MTQILFLLKYCNTLKVANDHLAMNFNFGFRGVNCNKFHLQLHTGQNGKNHSTTAIYTVHAIPLQFYNQSRNVPYSGCFIFTPDVTKIIFCSNK